VFESLRKQIEDRAYWGESWDKMADDVRSNERFKVNGGVRNIIYNNVDNGVSIGVMDSLREDFSETED